MVVDTQTLLVPEFTYDGLGPAAYWWVSRGARQHPRGLRLPDEHGSYAPLPKYTGKTVVITLPEDYTIYDFDWFGVWCDEARVDFGSVALPQNIVVPPSPRSLGIELEYKLNCEVLRDDLGYEVRWIMDGEDIVMQLVARLEPGEYMSFGLSKNDTKSDMIKADAIVAWIDKRRRGHAVDYYLGSKEQCVGRRGSCPDVKFPDGQDSVQLLNAAAVNGYTMITLKRPQVGIDEKYDQHVYSDGPQAIVWAIGPLNEKDEVSYHGALRSEGDVYIDFARPPQWNCPQPADPDHVSETTTTTTTTTTRKPTKRPSTSERSRKPKPTSATFRRKPQPIGPRYASRASDVGLSASTVNTAWNVPPIMCPSDRTFRAQIGPTGGKKGYQSITGDVGWGIAWYINGVLIPEITVERGKTYTFIVEGGHDVENPARTHPLYITDDPEGGFEYKTAAEKKKVKVYAGVSKDRRGNYSPTAMGRLCEWKLPKDLTSDDFETFDEFQESLELRCERGKPGRLIFKPDQDTPDLLYYQCYTHRHLGWKIHVVDSCSEAKGLHHEASVQHVKNVTYNTYASDYKRGGDKKRISLESDEESSEIHYEPKHSGNDGVPLNLPSDDSKTLTEKKTVTSDEPQKQLYYRPTASVYYSPKTTQASKSTWNNLYYLPTTETSKQNQYFFTTPESKSLYYKHSTTRAPTTRKSHSTTHKKFVTPKMEVFHIRDVIPSNGQQGTYILNKSPTEKSTAGVKTIILSPTQRTPDRSKIYQNTQKPYRSSGGERSKTQWWIKPTTPASDRQKALHRLRSQLDVIQGTKTEPKSASSLQHRRAQPYNVHYENSFIPIVVNNNGSFDEVVARAPSHNPHLSHHGSPAGHILALTTTNQNGRSVIPVLIRDKEPVRRTIGSSKESGIQTPLGRLPYPNPSPRRKNAADENKSGESYLPLLVPQRKANKSSTATKQRVAPLIPLVVPEKKGDNLYILHQMLSLLNENPQNIAARGIKIVNNNRDRNVRTRVARSADHHHEHSSGHEHEDHDPNHEGHEMHHKEPSQKSTAFILPVPIHLLLFISAAYLLKPLQMLSIR
ncbi:Protein Skeletor, isoforms D/E, partial [Stegodyphus mimosarum]